MIKNSNLKKLLLNLSEIKMEDHEMFILCESIQT